MDINFHKMSKIDRFDCSEIHGCQGFPCSFIELFISVLNNWF
jgi:hypothetical protein